MSESLFCAEYDRIHAAKDALERAVEKRIRPGDLIEYSHGENSVRAWVERTHGAAVFVQGVDSGKVYWISAYRVEHGL